MGRVIYAADLFCGAGGTSAGLIRACEALGWTTELLAVNHWEIAVATHAANHPSANHLCASLDSLDPRKAIPGGRLDLLVASPECTHHSIARGGRPCSDQSRATAWCVLRWIDALRPRHVLIENVKEFQTWGPLDLAGQPIKVRRGETYGAFVNAIRSLGYTVEARVLNAADYGDATTRRRLFIVARLGDGPIAWPMATHAPEENGLPKWRPARDIIDWSLPGTSIFHRKRPLAPRTLARIEYGLRKFGGAAAEPFLVLLKGQSRVRSIHQPIPAVTTTPWLYLCEPFIASFHGGERHSPERRVHGMDQPLPTVDTSNRYGVVSPFLIKYRGTGQANPVDQPLHTITASGSHYGLVKPFLIQYYGESTAQDVGVPLPTVTTKDRFGLVESRPELDITLRMLQPHELAAAMSFPAGYQFTGTKQDQVRQIGNAVPVREAEALCRAALEAA